MRVTEVLLSRNLSPIDSPPLELVPSHCGMTQGTFSGTRRYERISLPNGMFVAWYGGGEQQVSRAKTLGKGGLFLSVCNAPPVGTKLKLAFEVPGGSVQADGIIRDIVPSEGIGIEFTRMGPRERILLDGLLRRLLR